MHKKTRVKVTSRVIAFIMLLLLLASVFPFTLLVTAQHAENYYSETNELSPEYVCDKKSDISYNDSNVMSSNENPANVAQPYDEDEDYDYDYVPAIVYSIIFMPGGSSVTNMPHNRFVVHGSTIGTVSTPIRPLPITFVGWIYRAESGPWVLIPEEDISGIVVTRNMVFEAAWANQSTVNIMFLAGGDYVTGMPNDRLMDGAQTILDGGGPVETPSREGHTFLGWLQLGATGNVLFLSSSEVENIVAISDMTFEAQWELIAPPYEYRDIYIYYYLQDENGELHRDMENNPLGRQYTRRVDTIFSLEDVLDRNALPDNKVYTFEGWRVYLGETPDQNYLADMDTTQLHGSFVVPAPSESAGDSEAIDIDDIDFDELQSTVVGEIINLVAVWSYETKTAVPMLHKTPDRTAVRVGETIDWSLRNFHNHTNTAVSNFSIIEVPGKGLNFTSASLPAFANSAGVTYSIMYRVYGSATWQVYSSGISASQPFSFSLSQPGDLYYTHIKFLFGTVPANFGLGNEIIATFYVGEEAPDGQLVNNFWTMWDGSGVRDKSSVENESSVEYGSDSENVSGGGNISGGGYGTGGGYVSGDTNVSDGGHGTGSGNIIGGEDISGASVTAVTPSSGDGEGRLPQTGNGSNVVLWLALVLLAILVATDISATIKRYNRYNNAEK